jgi:hypothetical protein
LTSIELDRLRALDVDVLAGLDLERAVLQIEPEFRVRDRNRILVF